MDFPDDFGGVGIGLTKKNHPAGPASLSPPLCPILQPSLFHPRPAGGLPLIRDFALHPRGDMAAEGEFWQFVDEVWDGGKNVTGGERGPSV